MLQFALMLAANLSFRSSTNSFVRILMSDKTDSKSYIFLESRCSSGMALCIASIGAVAKEIRGDSSNHLLGAISCPSIFKTSQSDNTGDYIRGSARVAMKVSKQAMKKSRRCISVITPYVPRSCRCPIV